MKYFSSCRSLRFLYCNPVTLLCHIVVFLDLTVAEAESLLDLLLGHCRLFPDNVLDDLLVVVPIADGWIAPAFLLTRHFILDFL